MGKVTSKAGDGLLIRAKPCHRWLATLIFPGMKGSGHMANGVSAEGRVRVELCVAECS